MNRNGGYRLGVLTRCVGAPLYAAGMWAYDKAISLAAMRYPKARLLAHGRKEAWRLLAKTDFSHGRWVWIHVASLGEFEQARPLIEALKTERPELKILLTFFSPSGYEVRKNYPLADLVTYLPADTPYAARRFVRTVRPSLAIFVKYEIWRNYLLELQRIGTPALLICAAFRPGQLFFKPWGAWYRDWLRAFTHIFVQDGAGAKLLADAGITDVTVAGDTRFDRVAKVRSSAVDLPEVEAFCQGADNVFVVGSSWPVDEALYLPWLRKRPDVKTIVAPHEFDSDRLAKLLKDLPGAVLHSQLKADSSLAQNARTLIIDSFGLLSSLYRYGTVAYVGGGFGAGLHNINEAAVYGIPVVYGPNNHKFIEARELAECGGGFPISDASTLHTALDRLMQPGTRVTAGHAADAYIRSRLGATERILTAVRPLLLTTQTSTVRRP